MMLAVIYEDIGSVEKARQLTDEGKLFFSEFFSRGNDKKSQGRGEEKSP